MYQLFIILIIISLYLLYKYRYNLFIKYEYFKTKFGHKDTIVLKDNIAIITFYKNSIEHKIRLPFISKNKHKFYKMIAIKDEQEIDITHFPGIPYFLNCKNLDCEVIIKRLADDDINTFIDDEIPSL